MPIKGVSELKHGRDLGFAGPKISRKYAFRICKTCGNGQWIRADSFRDTCKKCSAKKTLLYHLDQKGNKNPNWHGGISLNQGYRLIRLQPDDPFYPMAKGSGYVLEHRLVLAKKLGRLLKPQEKVHHINGDKLYNDETNLELITDHHRHELSYSDGYKRGYKDGQKARVGELEKQIKELKTLIHERGYYESH